jgi:hypothetical protein
MSVLSVNTGLIPEFTGWFTSLEILFRDESGNLRPVQNLKSYPTMNMENNQWLKPHFMTYWYTFEPLMTTEIVLRAGVGGIPEDGAPADQPVTYTISVSEVGLYSE